MVKINERTKIGNFLDFLRKHGCLTNFRKNALYYPGSAGSFIGDLLSCAFYWSSSPEGFAYWHRISVLWYKELRKYEESTSKRAHRNHAYASKRRH